VRLLSSSRFALGFLLLFSCVYAADNYWYSLDPAALPAKCLLFDRRNNGAVRFAGGPFGLAKSTDSGTTWNDSSDGLTGPVYALVQSQQPDTILAGTAAGLFRSTDLGRHWQSIGGLETKRIESISMGTNVLYAVAISPTRPETITGADAWEVLKSTDNGATWQSLPLPELDRPLGLTSIAVHPQDPQIVLVGCAVGAFRTADGGATWSLVTTSGDNPYFLSFAFDRVDPNRIYGGTGRFISISTDKGLTWLPVEFPGSAQWINVLRVDREDPNVIWASGTTATYYSFFKSTDRGETWTPQQEVNSNSWEANDMLFDPAVPAVVWFATDRGVIRVEAVEGGWRKQEVRRTPAPLQVLADPASPNLIYGLRGTEFYRTTDGGGTWTKLTPLNQDYMPDAFTVEPGNPTSLWAVSQNALYKSTDSGDSWKQIRYIEGSRIYINPANRNQIYVLERSGRLKRTKDGGDLWIVSKRDVLNVAFDHTNASIVYAACLDGLYQSTNAGFTWRYLDGAEVLGYTKELIVDPLDPQVLYSVKILDSWTSAVWRSRDGGASWQQVSWFQGNQTGLIAGPPGSGAIFAVTGALRRSTDQGETWTALTAGFPIWTYGVQVATAYPVFRSADGRHILAPGDAGPWAFDVEPTLIFPSLDLSSSSAFLSGFAFANLSDRAATLKLEALRANGSAAEGPDVDNPVDLSFLPGHQRAAQPTELFRDGLKAIGFTGWVRATSDQEQFKAFSSLFTSSLAALDTIPAMRALMPGALFPVVPENGEARFCIANPLARAVLVELELLSDHASRKGEPVKKLVAAGGSLAMTLDELFGAGTAQPTDFVRVWADSPVAFLELLEDGQRRVAGLPGLSTESPEGLVRIPQFVVGYPSIRTVLHLANAGGALQLSIAFRSDAGVVLASTSLDMPVGKMTWTGEELFPELAGSAQTGYLELKATHPLNGVWAAVTIEDPAGERFLTAIAGDGILRTDSVLSHLASDASLFTGISAVNPNDHPADATIEVFRPDGSSRGLTNVTIPARGRLVGLLTDLLPELRGQTVLGGYARVRSDQPLACFGIFGPWDLSAYASVPAQ